MRKSLGSGFGVLAFLAFTVHSTLPRAAEQPATPADSVKIQGKQKPAEPASPEGTPLEGPWLATRSFFSLTTRELPPDRSSSLVARLPIAGTDRNAFRDLLGLPAEGYEMESVVATVVNPMHTHLPLLFDEQIEAIESAAERQHWEFAGQWLPWAISRPSADETFKDRVAEQKFERAQEALPGVLVFRHQGGRPFPIRCLLVFLVPEMPTAGIAAAPFNAALNLALAATDRVGLLAPTFSGSFDSLTKLVRNWPELASGQHAVYSGTTKSSRRAKVFFEETGVPFHSGVASIDADHRAFKKVLSRYGIPETRAAYLVEGESGYANAFMPKEDRTPPSEIVTYRYPRDIATLRNAYQESKEADPTKASDRSPVDFTMKDRSHGEDTVPIFSESHTPVVQSALLGSIARDFRENQIEMVYVVATNNLDALFLARAIRRGSPGTRVLIEGADLLFVPAAAQESITGTLFLSTYPVFLQGSKWTSDADGHIHAFPSANFQGLFIATQQLLRSMGGSDAPGQPGFAQFPVDASKAYPGLWLLSLTRHGFAPIDWFENDADVRNDRGFSWFDTSPSRKTLPPAAFANPPLGWYLTVVGLSVAALFASLLLVRANFADASPSPFWLQVREHSTASALTLLGACLSLSLMILVLGLPAWQYVWQGSSKPAAVVFVSVLGALTPLLSFAITIVRLPALLACARLRHKLIAALLVVAYCFLATLWTFSCYGGNRQTDFFFRYRAVDLYSGNSPATPLLILCLVFLMRSMMLFRRYSEVAWDSPFLVFHRRVKMHSYVRPHVLAVEGHLKSGIASVEEGMKTPLAWRYTASGLLVILCLLPLWPSLRAFEQSPYNLSLQVAVALVLLAIAVACQDLIHMWRNLRSMLLLLEMSPLRGAIGRVVRHWPRQAVWALWRSISRQRLAAQMLLALHNRHQSWPEESRMLCDYVNFRDLSDVRFSIQNNKYGPDTSCALRNYEHECAILAAKILEDELVPYWDNTPLDDNGEPRVAEEETPEAAAAKSSADFVALQLCNYILFAVRHTQRLAWSVSLGLLLLILALASYQPQSPQLLGRILVVAFLGFGGVICWVLAGMEKNWVLSRIGRTRPGKLNFEFWARLGGVVVLPLSAVLVHLFPAWGGFLSNVIAPGMEALK